MTRQLTEKEIEEIIDFITPLPRLPLDISNQIMENQKERFRKQLRTQLVYNETIPFLKQRLEKMHRESLIGPGESVGIISACSIGSDFTQMTLNSVDWEEEICYTVNGEAKVKPIGEMIDALMYIGADNIQHVPENRTEYLELPDGFSIPSCDEDGNTGWYKIEAVTRHLPVGKLVKVTTQSGRTVTATQAKSFLTWDGNKFVPTHGSDLKVGDILPTTCSLPRPEIEQTHFDMETLFPKTDYLYTSEVVKAREYLQEKDKKKWWDDNKGSYFTVPYNRADTMLQGRRREFMATCEPGYIHIHPSPKFVSNIPDSIPLDNDFGFFVGSFLADGWVTKTFLGISNNDEVIRARITNYCDRYGITYHLVVSQGKNVRNGISSDLKVHSVMFARLFKAICDTGSANKKIPEFAYTAPNEFILGLLDGYFSGDGTVSKESGGIVATSVSKKLLDGISFLLSYYGIHGRLSGVQQYHNNVGSQNIKYMHTLSINNGFAQSFAIAIHLTESKKQRKLEEVTLTKDYRHERGRAQEEFPLRDIYFDGVTNIEEVEASTEFVYDLTVEHTRVFQVYNGINCEDTFHHTGACCKAMTTGVPRFTELLNATPKPKIVNCDIRFLHGNTTVQELRKTVGSTIVGLTLSDLVVSCSYHIGKEPEKWYAAYDALYDNRMETKLDEMRDCVSYTLNIEKMYEYRLSLQEVAEAIEDGYASSYCIFSAPSLGRLDVYVDTSEIELPEERLLHVTQENRIRVFLEEVVHHTLSTLVVCGIPGITDMYFEKKDGKWALTTVGKNYKQVLAHPSVDFVNTVSNDVWDIYDTLGIEASRSFLLEELAGVMTINKCHIKILIDKMTHSGTITAITRHTLKKDDTGPLGRSSFEESVDNFLMAAQRGEIERMEGVSGCIMTGKRAPVGTGKMGLRVDIDALLRMPEIPHQEYIQIDNKTGNENTTTKSQEQVANPTFVEIEFKL